MVLYQSCTNFVPISREDLKIYKEICMRPRERDVFRDLLIRWLQLNQKQSKDMAQNQKDVMEILDFGEGDGYTISESKELSELCRGGEIR